MHTNIDGSKYNKLVQSCREDSGRNTVPQDISSVIRNGYDQHPAAGNPGYQYLIGAFTESISKQPLRYHGSFNASSADSATRESSGTALKFFLATCVMRLKVPTFWVVPSLEDCRNRTTLLRNVLAFTWTRVVHCRKIALQASHRLEDGQRYRRISAIKSNPFPS